MSPRHRKALRTSLLLTACLLIPFYALWRVHDQDILGGMGDYGHVPEFLYLVENEDVGYSHFDTMKHISLLYLLREPGAESWQRAQHTMSDMQVWLQQELVSHDDSREKPPAIKTFLMSQDAKPDLETMPQGWGFIHVGAETPYLVPEAFRNKAEDAIVIIDDSGRYRAYLPVAQADSVSKGKRMLSKIAAHQNLLFYLTNQTLMWEKAKRVARGLEPYPSH